MRSSRPGFTLIELLVVIAIIAILAAILFPVFNKARQKAQASTCLSNIREIALASTMYSSDNDQLSVMSGSFSTAGKAMWPAPGGLNTANSGAAWTVEIYPYVKNIGIFSDPSQADTYVDYMFNVQSASCGYLPPTYTVQDSWTPSGSNLGQCYYPLVWIPNPATKIEFICGSYGGSPGNWMGSWPEITMAGGFLGGFNTPANPITRVTPHNGGANIAYFDGHVGFGTPQGIGIIQVANTGAWYPTATS